MSTPLHLLDHESQMHIIELFKQSGDDDMS